MLSRVVGMLSKSYDKSAQEGYCTNEGEHDRAASECHTAALPPTSEPELRPASKHRKSFNVHVPSRILSLCGGGHLCIAHLGVLKALQERDQLKYIYGLIGISAGALVALLYVLGYTLEQSELLLYTIDLSVFTAIESDSALLFYQTLCVNSGEKLDAFLKSLLENKGFSSTTTFAEMHKSGKCKAFFRCYATRVQKSDIQEFSVEKTPNHTIVFALRASMCLPIVFAPMKDPFTETLYYDAAIIHNMPFVFLTEEDKRHTLSVHFNLFKQNFDQVDMLNVFSYTFKSFYNLRNVYYLNTYKDSIICVENIQMNFLDCNKKEDKDALLERGYSACMSHLDAKPTRRIARRYSAS